MHLKTLLGIGFLLLSIHLSAQTDFKPGYVITNTNDTLYGEIDYRGDLLMGQVCKFRAKGHEVVQYTPKDIAAYRFIDSKYFVSREVAGKDVFLEFLIKGQVDVYYFRDKLGDHYFIEKENMPLTEIPYEEGFKEMEGGKQYSYKTKKHIGILNYYMQDAPEVQSEINDLRKPAHDNLIKLAEDYHQLVCKDGEPCVIFVKKQPLVKVTLDIAAGMIFADGHAPIGGVLLNFWMPRANEKIYFRTGALYLGNEISYEGSSVSKRPVFKIPIMFEYIYPKSVIRPKAAYGFSIYNMLEAYSASCMGGVNIQLHQSVSCFLEYHLDFASRYLIIPERLVFQTFLGGLEFRF